ncbi:phospholipid/cholesterol/gamma-HCH transport system substrate-binding protein [Herbihabitans rhizosphaerae]|uniref:Phospholipid/cholesterol/gamma-HCH transport system substrate-binding protein n=1 Tax=Herbihabitans rhizosphaerae TaxID=1872711 RepID=A0A4Q7KNH9_9PSEU|nr:MlaD family protein [Herbihabitans rhizosphaerae]RZS37201.1 phospholipid/cholesterol/gamma-HCH transport system substrate-binding protein [Herbihabitans rhizosphaerae]
MITRKVRLQLIAFAVIAVVAVVYALFRFAGLGKVLGNDGYTVTMRLADSGGIFTNAEVTYRGLNVGRVGDLRLTKDGLEVDLNIEPEAPEIPADLDAVVSNRSAVGEQYVDLRPTSNAGPRLNASSVIPVNRTKTPIGTDVVIKGLDQLSTSVPTDALRTVVDELDKAFSGTGPDLQILMDSLNSFTKAARNNLPNTTKLINDLGPVLNTQVNQSGNIKSFSGDLKLLAEQLKSSDPDIRRLIQAGPPVAESVTSLLRESGPGLSSMVANLLTTSNILVTRLNGIEFALVSYPMISGVGKAVLSSDNDGTGHLGFALNLWDPPPCVRGYEGTDRRNGNEVAPKPENGTAYCAEPLGSPIGVRGSQNAPYGGKPAPVPTPGDIAANQDRTKVAMADLYARGMPSGYGQPGIGPTSLAGLLGLPG